MKTLKDWCVEGRRAKGWSQQKLAEKARVALDTVSALEQGRTDPTVETLRKLGKALGSTPPAFDSPRRN
jgi:XRE family transcriptional regulator, regulator of sulfur utilization